MLSVSIFIRHLTFVCVELLLCTRYYASPWKVVVTKTIMTSDPRIASMRGTWRNTSGCLICGPHALCPPEPHPLFSISMASQILFIPNLTDSQGKHEFCSRSSESWTFPYFLWLTITHPPFHSSNIYTSEKPFLPTSPDYLGPQYFLSLCN